LIARLHREHQLTSVIATHNISFARRCDRVLRLHGGRLEELKPDSLT
jgi:lipoprotein-releasing system ATP-binding protein